jgi:recombination protein RecA
MKKKPDSTNSLPSWIQKRCKRCIYHGTEEERALYGDDLCLRDYPRTKIKEKCRIKPSKYVPWRDAFTPRPQLWNELELDQETMDLMKKPVRSFEEDKAVLEGITRAHKKVVESKGGTARLGFGSDFDEDMLSVYRAEVGVPSIDLFLGGGFPTAPFTISGKESTGKTTTILLLIASLQAQGYICAYVDAEHTFDAEWATMLGVNVAQLLINQDQVMEDQLNWVLKLAESGHVDMIFYDSLNAGLPRGKLARKSGKERDLDNADVALRARVMSDFFPRIVHHLKINQIGFGLIVQERTTGIGSAYVRDEAGGGNARKFFDSIHIQLRRGAKADSPMDDDKNILGFPFVMNCLKSKVSGIREGDKMQTIFWLNRGFDPVYEYVVMAMEQGIIEVGKSSCKYTDSKGKTHTIRGAKEWKVAAAIKELGLQDDVRMLVTGEVPPEEESETTEVE